MTTIIISILAALGIGGGVMLASSGGGSSSGGAAVVAPVNPDTSGGGSNTGGTTTGGGSNTGGSNTGGSNTGGSNTGGSNTGGSNTGGTTGGNTGGTSGSSNVGALLASGSLSGVSVVGKAAHGNTTLSGKNLTIGITSFAPILVSGTTYKTNEEYGTTIDGKYNFVSGYTADNPVMKQTINLNSIKSSNNYADFYNLPAAVVKNIPTLNAKLLTSSSYMQNTPATNLTDVTWTFNLTNFALGARKLGLQYSDFGYYTWKSVFTNYIIEHGYSSGTGWVVTSSSLQKRYTRYGGQQFYMFNTSRQFKDNNYTARYGNTATFKGNVIGFRNFFRTTCGVNNVANITGDITLNLNLANKAVSGSITNTSWYDFTLTGVINNVGTSTPNNITFTNVDYNREQTNSINYYEYRYDGNNLTPINENGNFGDAVIVKGSSASKDEMVGQLAFTGHTAEANSTSFNNVFISFGAIKK